MKTRFLLLLPLALLLWGCPTDKDNNPEPEQECRLLEINYEATVGMEKSPSMTQKVTFSYNQQGQLISVSADSLGIPWQTRSISYDSKGRIAQVASAREVYANEYNAQDQRVKQTRSYQSKSSGLQEHDYYTFSYNSRNELEEARYFYLDNNTPAHYGTWRYTYTNGDPTTIVFHSPASQQQQTITRWFDDQKRYPHDQASVFFQPLEAPSAHNLLGYDVSDPNMQGPTFTAAYTYTSQGYPATIVKTYRSTGLVENLRYTYSCQ